MDPRCTDRDRNLLLHSDDSEFLQAVGLWRPETSHQYLNGFNPSMGHATTAIWTLEAKLGQATALTKKNPINNDTSRLDEDTTMTLQSTPVREDIDNETLQAHQSGVSHLAAGESSGLNASFSCGFPGCHKTYKRREHRVRHFNTLGHPCCVAWSATLTCGQMSYNRLSSVYLSCMRTEVHRASRQFQAALESTHKGEQSNVTFILRRAGCEASRRDL